MLIQLIASLLIGILFGTITGLTPGIHINLIGAILISLSSEILYQIPQVYLVVFITSMAITHTFLDFIPSIFLGCPDTDTELSILPGHELLKKGKGYEAVVLTAFGSIAAIFLLIIISFPAIFFLSKTYNILKSFIPYCLILISLTLIFLEKNKFSAFWIFSITGLLGLCVLKLGINQPLLPLLTGLFGGSMIVSSIKNKVLIPEQQLPKKIKPPLKMPLLGAIIASPLCSLLPGLGSGQAAIIGNLISRSKRKGFLVLLGATNTLVMGFSFISLYTISKTRTGAAVALQSILAKNFSMNILILIIITIIITGIACFFITLKVSKIISRKIHKIKYSYLSIATLFILVCIVLIASKFIGLIILLISTLTGLYALSFKIKRTNMMGCLLIPVIIYYLF